MIISRFDGCLLVLLAAGAAAGLAGCRAQSQAIAERPVVSRSAAQATQDDGQSAMITFFDDLESRPLAACDDAVHAALLLGTGRSGASAAERRAMALELGYLPNGFDRPPNQAVNIGETARLLAAVLERPAPSDEAALRALVGRGILPATAQANQGLTGAQLVSMVGMTQDAMATEGVQRVQAPVLARGPDAEAASPIGSRLNGRSAAAASAPVSEPTQPALPEAAPPPAAPAVAIAPAAAPPEPVAAPPVAAPASVAAGPTAVGSPEPAAASAPPPAPAPVPPAEFAGGSTTEPAGPAAVSPARPAGSPTPELVRPTPLVNLALLAAAGQAEPAAAGASPVSTKAGRAEPLPNIPVGAPSPAIEVENRAVKPAVIGPDGGVSGGPALAPAAPDPKAAPAKKNAKAKVMGEDWVFGSPLKKKPAAGATAGADADR